MPKNILIVDDESDLVELLAFNLRKADYEVDYAFTASEALEKARTILPDLIILDLMLPELDGTAVCEILRRQDSTANIPVLMLTACASDEAKLIALQAGADGYITKPFSLKELISYINATLAKRHSMVAFEQFADVI